MKLAADLGGTHARFALQSEVVTRVDFAACNYDSADEVIAAALAAFDIRDAHAVDAVLAAAGPVRGATVEFTNLDWRIDADALRARFGFASVRLLNDVESAARGAATALPSDAVELQPGRRFEGARHALISVGTGLGVAYWRDLAVDASEAGHSGFAPATQWDHALLDQLQNDSVRVSWEHVLSGPGLTRIDSFMSGAPCADAADVTQRAAGGDPRAIESIRHFSRLLGTFAGDLVLAAPVTGGVLLAGGVLAGLGAHFDDSAFLAGFHEEAVPVWRTTDGGLALRGALL